MSETPEIVSVCSISGEPDCQLATIRFHFLTRGDSYWMNKLYESLFPPDSRLGTVIALSKKRIPEAQKHSQQVKYWCQDLLKADAAAQALRMVLRIANLSFAFDHRDAPRYLTDFPELQKLRQRPILMRDGQCVVDQLLSAMEGKDPRFIDKGVSFFRYVREICTPRRLTRNKTCRGQANVHRC